jgi:hypothetical protein
LKDGRHGLPVRYTFEKGDREHEITETFRELDKNDTHPFFGPRGHGFEPKYLTLLQPADLIAGAVQRCLRKAHTKLPCFDNGAYYTSLATFESSYSKDGVTGAVVKGFDRSDCFVANVKSFSLLDNFTSDLFTESLEKLSNRTNWQYTPKRRQQKK